MIKQLLKIFSRKYFLVFFCGMLMMQVRGWAQVIVAGASVGNGTYTTLRDAFTAIASATGTITISITGDTNEGTNTATLGAGSWTSITISPTGGATRTISGNTTAGNPLIDLNGADNVTFDGLNTGGNALIISNTTVSATSGTSTIRFIGGATSNTITNCSVLGSATMAVNVNGGNIFFSTDGVTANGNDNNTISNCNIGPAGVNLPTKGIYGNGTTSTTAIGNSGITITNNNIFNYFGAATTSAGIYVNGGCNTWSITNNRLYQTATRTWTTGANHDGINIQNTTPGSGAQGFTITGNIIGYASNIQTGTYTLTGSTGKFRGIVFNGISGGTSSTISNNTIASVSLTGVTSNGTGTSSPFMGIFINEGTITSNNNVIGSQSATGSLTFSTNTTTATDVYGMYNFSSDVWTSNNNNIGGITVANSSTGASNLYGLRCFTGSGVTWTCNNNTIGGTVPNSMQSTSTATGTVVQGILNSSPIGTFTSNIIRNMSVAGGTGTTTTASMVGICITSTANQTISQNTIFNLSNTHATAATTVTGIQFTGGSANIVERNFIYNLTSSTTSTSAEINGIRVGGGTTVYRNNMIALGAGVSNAIGSAATNGSVSGINGFNGFLGTDSFWHNSIYIGGTATAGTGASYAFNGVQTTNTRSFRNNIFVNARTNSGATGKHYAVKINGTAPNPTGLTINNNNYFVSGTGGVLGFFNGLDVASLAAWQTAVGQDANSVSGNPNFIDPTNAVPDLHINTTLASIVDVVGASLEVTNDYDNDTRASFTPNDIGADAFMVIPSLSIADNGTQPSAGNVNQGSISNILQSFTITEGNVANATLNTVTIPTGGNYVAADIQTLGFKLWRNTTNSFAGATAFTGVTSTASGSGETITFSSLNFSITKNTTVYFWVTADISPTATANNTLNANALAPANFTFALGTPTGTVSAGGTQTILTATPTISLASGAAPVTNPTQNTTNVVLYRVDVTVATTAALLNAIQFTTAGTYTASDVLNYKIWYHTNSTFTTGTPTQIGSIAASGTGLKTFTGLTQSFPIGTNYVFLTTDLPCTAVVNNTISVNAILNTDVTFVTSNFGANTATGSGTVTINAVTINNVTALTPTAGDTQVSLAWTAPAGCVNEIMIIVAPASNTGTPTGDGGAYTANLTYGSGTALGNGFVAYKGNTSPQVITGLTNFTTYYFKVFTRNGTNWSSGVEVNATPMPVYCGAPLTTTINGIDIITNVLLTNAVSATYSNASTSNGTNNYVIYNNTPLDLERGTNNSIAITFGTDGTQHSAVWIDYNQNGVYEASENIALSSSPAGGGATVTYNFTIPMGANLGNTRMRVRGGSDGVYTAAGACTTTTYGETEDYLVNITPASPQTLGTIAGVQATPATTNKNTTNNPILRIDLPTSGALGTLTLTNLVVTSANVNDADIATNGVKLYYTTTPTFSTANPVGTGQSFSSGTATFSGLTRLLATGNNYIWVAYDVATTATIGNTLDAQVSIGNITITEAGGANATGSIPVSALNPAGSVLIIPRNPQPLTATAFSNSQINLTTSVNADSDNIMVAWNSTNTFGTPTGTYVSGNPIAGGGTVWYVGTVAGLTNHTGLTANTQYFYSVWTVSGSTYSTTAQTANATTLPNPLNYVFSQSNGTYTEITPTTTLFSGTFDDGLSSSQTIPSFTYNGVAYTNMFVSANGFLKLGGASGPSGSNYTPLSTVSTAYQNIVSAFGQDLNHDGSGSATVGWSTIGNEVIVQWKNVRRWNVAGESVNFQIRLNTITGDINIVYGTCTSGTSTNTMQVGIRGFDETWRTQISNRQHNLNWDRTTMGTNNTSALPMTSTNLPASGLTFTYTPNTCTPFPIIGAVTQSGANVTVNWTAQAEALDGYDVRYRLQSAGIGTYTVVNVPGQASNNTIITGLSEGTYIFEVRSRCSGSTFSDYSNAIVFNVTRDYYLKPSGVITNIADWGTNTDGTGTNPTAITQTNTIWNIRNNTNVTNPAAWTLGTGSKIVVGDGVSATNFTLPVGANVTGTIDVANLGTLTLQNTTNPTLGTLAAGSTVDYAGTGAQTIAIANYSNLTISGARTGSPTITLASGTIGISNNFTITATGVGSYTNTGNTIDFSGTGMQTIPAFTYRNITNTGNGNRTLASSGEINIAGTFSLGTGAYTVTGSTVNYSATTGGPFTMASFNYHNVIFSGTQTFSIGSGNTINVAGNFTKSGSGTVNVSNAAGTSTLSITGSATISAGNMNVSNSSGTGVMSVGNDLNLSGGILTVISNSSAPSTTLNITRDFIISSTGRILLESTGASAGRTAIVNVGRDFISTGSTTASLGANGIVDFASSGVAADNNAINIARNFSHTGTGNFGTGSTSAPSGFVFNGGGTLQTFTYTGVSNSQYVPYIVGANSQLQMLSNLTLPSGTIPRSNFTVNTGAILDMGTRVISTTNNTDAIFTLSSGATIKTAHASGLTSNFAGFTAGTTLLLNSGANYEFNGTVPQVTSAFVTTPVANTVNNLTINNTTSTSTTGVTLSSNLTVSGVLNLIQGKLTTGSNTLTIQAGASAVSPALGKANSYVVGNVSITSNTDGQTLLFPMGAGTWWGPARLVTNGGTANATNFSVTYYNVPSVLNSAPLPTTPEIITNALHAYWDINKVSGGRNADVQLYWNGNLGQITDRTKLRVLHGNGAVWENYGVDNTNGDAADGTLGSNAQGSIIKNAVSVFSPFTIGSIDSSNPLPLNLISFNPTRMDEEKVNVMWQTANEIGLKHFVIEKSKDAINFVTIINVDAQNPTPQIKNYEFVDNENESAYYRLRFVHFNSPDEFSPVRYVKGNQKQDFVIVYPNPLKDEIAFKVSENLKQNKDISLQVIDNQGKIIASFVGDWQTISQQISAAHPNWQNGVYTWIISPKGEKKQILKVIKL